MARAKYINPYTDFGFKKLFGEEANKDLLIDFLNQLLPEVHQIKELNFSNVEKFGDLVTDRKAIFDINCISITGERFVVEMQKAKIQFFKDRALFYTTFPIKEQAQKGRDWSFQLAPIYFIAILDFYYDEDKELAKFKRDVQLKDQDCEVFFDKLTFTFLQMPAFNKKPHELETKQDKWMYFLKHLEDFEQIPAILKEPIFEKAFNVARIANFNQKELTDYERSLLSYWDMVNAVTTAGIEGKEIGMEIGMKKGMKKGITKGKIEMIINGHKAGISLDVLSQMSGKTTEEVEEIIKNAGLQ